MSSPTSSNSNQVQKNHFLDEYNGRPTLETIHQLMLQKRQTGDLSRKIWVDVGWALEKEEFFISQTNYTWAAVMNAPKQLYEMEQRMLKAQNDAVLEHQTCQDLLVENSLLSERIDRFVEESKLTATKLATRVIKLPISKVKTFLAFCKPEDDIEDFYVQIDDKGNMQRIVRKPEEL